MEKNKVEHLGVIMDGNRRWARKNNGLPVFSGHEAGARRLMDLCGWCLDRRIAYLSVYALSTENLKRSAAELKGLFILMEKFFKEEVGNCISKGIKIVVAGDRSLLPEKQQRTIEQAEKETAHCDKLFVQIAIGYGGKNELTRAIRKIVGDIETEKIKKEEITEDMVEKYLDTIEIPQIDMIIRTGGNHRLSNFFIWQSAYAELYFTDTLWPDFSEEEFQEMLDDYSGIKINMGK